VFNHLIFTVETHMQSDNKVRIVGFEIEPVSIDWHDNPCTHAVTEAPERPAIYDKYHHIWFTYETRFKESQTLWAHRFDHYVKTGNDAVHHI
jgi:transmembrane 9 superfamily member 2/4